MSRSDFINEAVFLSTPSARRATACGNALPLKS